MLSEWLGNRGGYEVVAPAGDAIEFTGSNVSAGRATAGGIGTAYICAVVLSGQGSTWYWDCERGLPSVRPETRPRRACTAVSSYSPWRAGGEWGLGEYLFLFLSFFILLIFRLFPQPRQERAVKQVVDRMRVYL